MKILTRTAACAGLLILAGGLPPSAEEPVLLGRVQPEAVLSISPEWLANHDTYEPAEPDLVRIRTLCSPATLDVYFGSWCSDSRREVPRMLKVLERASPDGLKVRFYGLDRTKKKPARLARRGAIERVPTFILSAGGREVGRIVETPQTSLEHDFAVLIERTGPCPSP